MTLRRRELLAGGAGLTCAIMLGGGAARASLPGRGQAPSLLLYSQSLHREALALRGDAAPGRWLEQPVFVLSRDGFTATHALLRRSGPCRVLGLLDDVDGLVIDRMLAERGAREMQMSRTGAGALLLTAIL